MTKAFLKGRRLRLLATIVERRCIPMTKESCFFFCLMSSHCQSSRRQHSVVLRSSFEVRISSLVHAHKAPVSFLGAPPTDCFGLFEFEQRIYMLKMNYIFYEFGNVGIVLTK